MGVETSRKDGFVAIVDDDISVRAAIEGVLKSVGFKATSFESAEAFLASGQLHRSACIIADIQMSGMSGLELQERLAAEGHSIPFVIVTAYRTGKAQNRATKAGAVAFLDKPFDDEQLIEIVRTAIRK